MGAYQIILADDHLMFRNGIKRIIEDSKDLSLVGKADNGMQLLEQLKRTQPDMVFSTIDVE
jgi:DNA-binding NarL/FixJ family response regulator